MQQGRIAAGENEPLSDSPGHPHDNLCLSRQWNFALVLLFPLGVNILLVRKAYLSYMAFKLLIKSENQHNLTIETVKKGKKKTHKIYSLVLVTEN